MTRAARYKKAHFVCRDLFTPEFYARLDQAFGEVLDRGLAEDQDPTRFSRSIKNYDAYSMNFHQAMPEPFHIFISWEWHDMLANLGGVRATRDINGGFHHHLQGSKSGQVHNDLNPGWFLDNPNPSGINLSQSNLCDYSTGCVYSEGLQVHETVRALACLIFLHNPPWRAGDGGETGLYSYASQPISSPTKAIPPINNSLLMFECRPNSYHSFIGNRSGPRNSVIMWLHRPKSDAEQRWGADSIVYWRDEPKNQPL
jgi:Rps23 Pro-64 3,4-dihydroxylase Tpa1-like proline 4-hydroxylase